MSWRYRYEQDKSAMLIDGPLPAAPAGTAEAMFHEMAEQDRTAVKVEDTVEPTIAGALLACATQLGRVADAIDRHGRR